MQLHARARRLGGDRVGEGREPLDAVDLDLQVLAPRREDLLVQVAVAVPRAEDLGGQVRLADGGQDPDHHHVRAHGARPLLGAVQADPDRILELREHLALEPPRRHVDLDVELADLGLEVGVRDRLERAGVRQGGVAGLVGEVQLDLEAERAPVGVEARLAQHAREDVQAGPDLLPVALAVLAREDSGLDLLSHGLTLSSAVHVSAVHLHHVQAFPGPPARQAGSGGHLAVASSPGRRSACSARTARASPPCSGSWPGRTPSSAGDAQLAPGATVGLLEQEPQLDPAKDVRGNVEDGVRELRDMLDRFNELAANYSDETAGEFARLQDAIDAADAWNLDTTLEIAMDALRLPPGDADVETLSGGERRRVALCRLLLPHPTCSSSTSRRTTSTPSRWPGSRSTSRTTRARSWPSPTTATSSTTWPAGSSSSTAGAGCPSRATTPPGSSRSRSGSRRRSGASGARQRTIARELEWVRESPKGRRTKARARLKRYEALLAEEKSVKLDQVQIHIPAGPAARRPGAGDRRRAQGLRRPPADRGPLVHASARRASSA